MTRMIRWLPGLMCLVAALGAAAADRVVIPEAAYRDKVYACWLGKSIGGTLGMPVEGSQEPHDFAFFTPVPTQQLPNDDLDLQLLWLKVLQERGAALTCTDLGEYWLKYVPVDWNEYGVGKANMRSGIPPPLSGQLRNLRWRNSNGAWIRSEIWACVAPGRPELAARFAWHDACVDHGGAEGTYAEVFTATLESAAFLEHDRDRLIAIGLSYIPADCAVAAAVREAVKCHASGLDMKQTRLRVIKVTEGTGWFQAPRNVAFTIMGWLFGEEDFGKSICAAVNCGDDTDCTGATLASIWGIIHGTAGIPQKWRDPVGEGIQNIAIGGFTPPANLKELTEKTLAAARMVLSTTRQPVSIAVSGAASIPARLVPGTCSPRFLKAFWSRSPLEVQRTSGKVTAFVNLLTEADYQPGTPRRVRVGCLAAGRPCGANVAWQLPSGVTARRVGSGSGCGEYELVGDDTPGATLAGQAVVTQAGAPIVVPFGIPVARGVGKGDLALASRGAVATSDSELAREKGCTSMVIDGVLAATDDFEGKRWHSALEPHPHWVQVALPKISSVSRVVVTFADPTGHPVDFDLLAGDGNGELALVRSERGYAGNNRYEYVIGPRELKVLRLKILRSSSSVYPGAAQVSEIELLP